MSKIKIEIVKAQNGLKKGLETSVDSVHAISLIERGIAKFQNEEDETAYNERKAANAKAANDAQKVDAKKAKARTKGDDERQAKAEKEEADKKAQGQKMTLGRRKNLLKPFADFVDLNSDEFKLTSETTKEEFHVMQTAALQAKTDAEQAKVNAQKAADTLEVRVEELDVFGEHADSGVLTLETTEEEFSELLKAAEDAKSEATVENSDSEDDEETPEAPKKEGPKKSGKGSKK